MKVSFCRARRDHACRERYGGRAEATLCQARGGAGRQRAPSPAATGRPASTGSMAAPASRTSCATRRTATRRSARSTPPRVAMRSSSTAPRSPFREAPTRSTTRRSSGPTTRSTSCFGAISSRSTDNSGDVRLLHLYARRPRPQARHTRRTHRRALAERRDARLRARRRHVRHRPRERRRARLTNDATEHVYNGHFDWDYEEEFGMVQAWRWSPDSRHIAYWQLDDSEGARHPAQRSLRRAS